MTVDTDQLIWIIPVTLLLLVVLQFIHLIWLRGAPGSQRGINQPGEPILPNIPQSNIPTNQRQMDDLYGRMIITDGMPRREIALPSAEFTIGRLRDEGQNVLVALNERSISRLHATLRQDNGNYFLTDLGSSNGTFIQINGVFERIAMNSPRRIYDDDMVRFGNKINVRFVLATERRPVESRNSR